MKRRETPAAADKLVKLVLFSSLVHQAAFSAQSSLPFAIGQVQDAGLIFLSKIAGEIADAAAITTAMRCICFCYGQPMG